MHLDLPLPLVREVVLVEETASTNDLARELLHQSSMPLPFLVLARRQTAGRGRGSNRWWSDDGSLTFTVALRPETHGIEKEAWHRIALTAAVAVVESLESEGSQDDALSLFQSSECHSPPVIGIRWPNDIEARGLKLGGILPELFLQGGDARLLLGIGLNINTDLSAAPADIQEMATSLLLLRPSQKKFSPDLILRRILARLEAVLGLLAQDDLELATRWSRLDQLFGQPVRIDLSGQVITGTACGIGADGALRVLTPQGMKTFLGGTVLRDSPPTPPEG